MSPGEKSIINELVLSEPGKRHFRADNSVFYPAIVDQNLKKFKKI